MFIGNFKNMTFRIVFYFQKFGIVKILKMSESYNKLASCIIFRNKGFIAFGFLLKENLSINSISSSRFVFLSIFATFLKDKKSLTDLLLDY